MKKVLIMSPDNVNDKAYREQKILRALKELGGFDEKQKRKLFLSHCACRSGPVLQLCDDGAVGRVRVRVFGGEREEQKFQKTTETRKKLVMERGGQTLHARRRLTVQQLRELLCQLLYALDVAQVSEADWFCWFV